MDNVEQNYTAIFFFNMKLPLTACLLLWTYRQDIDVECIAVVFKTWSKWKNAHLKYAHIDPFEI